MKIATWNVNGIRAREAQLCEWMERDRPDVVCLQEIKARPDQVPDTCKLADYHAFWHGAGGYSGVSLHLRRELLRRPAVRAPDIRHGDAHRAGVARQPRACVGVRAQRRQGLRGEARLPARACRLDAGSMRPTGATSSCAATSTSPAADIDVHPKERKPGVIGQREEERALFDAHARRRAGRRRPRARSRQPRACSRGGRRGATCASATSAGGSTTSSHRSRIAERATECRVLADIGTSDHAPVMMTVPV